LLARRIVTAAVIAVSLSGPPAGAQQTRAFTPQEQAIFDAMSPSLEAAQTSAKELYQIEVQVYGRHAVLECRSRMLSSTAYRYCLMANSGH
jgi:hypothetical protein